MIDPQQLLTDAKACAKRLSDRGFILDLDALASLQAQRKQAYVATQDLQQQRNQLSKQVGQHKSKGEDCQEIMHKLGEIGEALKQSQQVLEEIQTLWQNFEYQIPNLPHASVPVGKDESGNVQVRCWGEPRVFEFEPKDHVDLGEALGQMDFAAASRLSGSRFNVLTQKLARLHRALIQFMLDQHTQQHGYQEVYVPYLLNESCFYGTGQLPKFRDDQFFIDGADMALLPTAEVALTNLLRDTIVLADQLPIQYVAHTPCFRREAGSYGKDTRGLIRQHQFEKVELVWFTQPESSYDALEQLTLHAETILQKLNLPYRVMELCTGDIGFAAAKTYDLEVWLPSQNVYREISSCSNCEAFQARRMHARWRLGQQDKPELLHTLNGSGLAVGRTLVAIMENYQRENGAIIMPDVLIPYCGFEEIALPSVP